jgi:DNA-binding NarL/FixJ family response regulator
VLKHFDLADDEIGILTKLARGESKTSVAKNLGVELHHLKYRLSKVWKKLNVQNAEQAIVVLTSLGLVEMGYSLPAKSVNAAL